MLVVARRECSSPAAVARTVSITPRIAAAFCVVCGKAVTLSEARDDGSNWIALTPIPGISGAESTAYVPRAASTSPNLRG